MSTPPAYAAPLPPAPQAAQPGVERVGRGLAFAAIVIPGGFIAAAVVFSLIPGIPIVVTAAGGLLVSTAAQWLYQRGAGTPPIRGLLGLIGIVVVAVIVTGIAGVVGNVYAGFQSVGGRGGPFGSTFRDTLIGAIDRDPSLFLIVTALLALGGVLGFVNKQARDARRAAREAAAGQGAAPFAGTVPYGAPAPISFDGAPAGAIPPVGAPPVGAPPVGAPPVSAPPVPAPQGAPVAPPQAAPPAPSPQGAPPAAPTGAPIAAPPPPAPTGLPGVTMTQLPGSTPPPPAPGQAPPAG